MAVLDHTILVWDAQILANTLEGHADVVFSVSYSPDGKKIISGSWDGTLRIWDAQSGTLENVLRGHTDKVNTVRYSSDGAKIISGSWDQTIRI